MAQSQGENQNYFDRLFAYYAQLDGIYGSYAKSHGEKYLSLWALEEIGDSVEGLSQKDIADRLFAPKQTISSVIAGLVERGMVETLPSKRDGRSKIHLLTPKGQKLFAEVRRDYARAEKLIFERLGAERIEQMFEGFAVVNDALACAFEEGCAPDEGSAAEEGAVKEVPAAIAKEARIEERRALGTKANDKEEGVAIAAPSVAERVAPVKKAGELRG